MRKALVLSGILHGALTLIAIFGLPHVMDRMVIMPDAIPVEVVDIGAITNAKVAERKDPPKPPPPRPTPPKAQPTPPPQQQQAEPTPPPPVKTPEPPKVAEKTPPKPEPPEEKPEPKKVAEAPKPEPKKPEPKKPEPKKEEPKKPEPPKKSFDSVLKNLEKLKEPTPPKEAPKQEQQTEVAETQESLDESRSDRLSITEEDALRRQLGQCWNVPAGGRGVETMSAEVRVFFDPSMTVVNVKYIGGNGSMSDPHYRAFVESALRAPLMPQCAKLNLPADKYGGRGTIVINFSPRDMF